MARWLGIALLVSIWGTAAVAGCGGGVSESEAKLRCDQDQMASPTCVTSAVYAKCIQCQEQCGDDCRSEATCPSNYNCPE